MNATQTASRSRLPLVLASLAVLAAALLIWLVFVDEDGASDAPTVVDVDGLSDAADRVGHPIYWVGEREDTRYELSESDSGRVYVRYLTGDAEAGERSTNHMTVGTYPVDDGVAALRRAAKVRPGAELARSDDGATILINPRTPGSVHLAYPGSKEQIEVYSPNVREGLELVTDGAVEPVP